MENSSKSSQQSPSSTVVELHQSVLKTAHAERLGIINAFVSGISQSTGLDTVKHMRAMKLWIVQESIELLFAEPGSSEEAFEFEDVQTLLSIFAQAMSNLNVDQGPYEHRCLTEWYIKESKKNRHRSNTAVPDEDRIFSKLQQELFTLQATTEHGLPHVY